MAKRQPITVVFNTADEFLDELVLECRNRPAVADVPIVRVAILRRSSAAFPGSVFHFSVAAGFVNRRGELVELDRYVGDAMTGHNQAIDKVNAEADDLRRRAAEIGCDVRSGRFQQGG